MLTMVKTRPVDFQTQKNTTPSTMAIFQNIPFTALPEIKKHMVERKYAKRESIFQEDDPAEFFWFVKQGHVKEINHSANGRDQTICMIGTNGMFGISSFNGGEYGFHSVAGTDTTVLSFPIQAFQALMEKYPHMARAVMSHISKLLQRSKDTQTFSQECAEKRLLHVLLKMTEEFGRTIPLTHKEIASMAGTAVETCSRVFSRLEEAGLITTQHGKFMIKNTDSLNDRMEEL